MKKKILFVYKFNALNEVIRPDGTIVGPADFLYGMNCLDRNKYEVDFINAPQGAKKALREKFLYVFERIFSKIAKVSIALEIYPLYRDKIKQAEIIFCANDGIALGLLFWKRLGFIKAEIIAMVQALPERIKYFRRFPFVRPFISWLLGDAAFILTFTGCAQTDFVRDFRLDKNKLKIYPFGADTDFWKIMPELQVDNFILSIGNDTNRDYATLVDALPENISLKIITKRPVDIKNKPVEILTGISNEEVRKLYNQALFVVIPSLKLKNESSGQSTSMQAMACGKAVILPRLPTMEEIYSVNEDCLYYDPENSADLREKIQLLLDDQTLRNKIAASGHKKVNENFTCQKMAERLEKIIG
jgi:glycosyltransferase involved in cell wall biosynthesis